MALLALYVIVALAVSFLCSILEAVLLSVTPAHVAVLEKQRHALAGRWRELKEDIDRPLAAILSLNTIAHTVGAAGAGAQAARVFGDNAVGVVSAILTLLILVATEIVPKTLGARYWKQLAPLVSRILRVLVVLMWPLVRLAQWLTKLLTRGAEDAAVSRDEIAAMAEEGAKEGVVQEGETRVMQNLLRLSAIRVADIMTPREHMVALPAALSVGEALQREDEIPFSRIPLYDAEPQQDRFTGYVLKSEILSEAAHDEHPRALAELSRDLLTMSEETALPQAFDAMLNRREHIALATRADGRVAGLVTMEDIVETLLGLDIFDEADDATRLQELAREHWRRRAERLGRHSTRARSDATLGISGGAPAADASAPSGEHAHARRAS